ncbi:MAG: antitoxin [Acidobacteria bacterium]|nr:antitoxin [Acidobacteriota bacterium]
MTTIQIRGVPEEVHRAYRERAAAAGMSLQEYLRAELTRNAMLRTPAEVAAETAERLRVEGRRGFAKRSSARIVHADRRAH